MLNKNLPKISIITPSFNQADFLEETIQSVLVQKYPNLEYIIIDGGSTDNSVEIIKKYEKHLAFWCSEPDEGQYDAINKGFAKSTGDIMAWLNSDDMYFSKALKTVASIMSELREVEWLTTLSPAGWDWHGFCTGFSILPGYSKEAFLDGYYSPWTGQWIGWIQQESTFWRRSLWEKAGSRLRTEFNLAGDFDLWGRFFEYAELYGTPSPLGGFRYRYNQRVRERQYADQAEKSLQQIRKLMNWKFNSIRSLLINNKLHKLPRIQKNIKSYFGYLGKKVVRKNSQMPDSHWVIETYKFL